MATDVATLSIRVEADQAKRELSGLEKSFGGLGKLAGALGVTLGAGAIFSKFIRETSQAQYGLAQLEAVLKSTGGAAGQSSKQLQAFAGDMQRLTVFSDDAVTSAQALLLTFTQIKGDTFPAATKAVLDLSQAMGGDLKGASIQIGKALNDPILGITALTRVGVSFTEGQKAVIKSLVESGQVAAAQAIILKELKTEFGGSAEAARETLGGALAGLKNSFDELFESTEQNTSGFVRLANAMTSVLEKVKALQGGSKFAQRIDAQLSASDRPSGNQGTVVFTTQAQDEAKRVGRELAAVREALAAAAEKEAVAVKELAQSYRDKSAATRRELDFGRQNLFLLIEQTRAEKKLADQRSAISGLANGFGDLGIGAPGLPGITDPFAQAARIDGNKKALDQMAKDTEQSARDSAERVKVIERDAAQATAAETAKIRENFLRQWQQTLSTGLAKMLTDGLASWRDFFGSVKDLFLKLAADMVAAKIMDKVFGTSTAVAMPAWAKVGAQIAVGFMIAVSASNATAQGILKAFGAGGDRGASRRAFQDYVNPGTPIEQKLADEAARYAAVNSQLWKSYQAGSITLRQYQEDTARAYAAMQVYSQAIRELHAEQERQFGADLRVRQLRASGMTEEAAAMELWNRQVKEFADAVRQGFSEELLGELTKTHDMERARAAIDATMAAEQKLADAREAHARAVEASAMRIAAAQERAAEHAERMAYATEDLGVRLLKAQGQTEEAERRAFALSQSREVHAAQNEIRSLERELRAIPSTWLGAGWNYKDYWGGPYGPEYAAAKAEMATIQAMIAGQNKYIAELKNVQAFEAVAFANGQSMPGASAAAPGTAGSFNTIVSRTTAIQGDRMVDELTTSRILLAAIEENTRPLRQGLGRLVNAALGTELQSAGALAGAGGVV